MQDFDELGEYPEDDQRDLSDEDANDPNKNKTMLDALAEGQAPKR